MSSLEIYQLSWKQPSYGATLARKNLAAKPHTQKQRLNFEITVPSTGPRAQASLVTSFPENFHCYNFPLENELTSESMKTQQCASPRKTQIHQKKTLFTDPKAEMKESQPL